MIENESRVMMSDSLRDSFNVENEETIIDSSFIGTASFTFQDEKSLFSVLKELKTKKNRIQFSVACRCDDAYSLFVDLESNKNKSFKKVIIEHKKQIQEIDLSNYHFDSFKVHSINNDEQTCVCVIKFKTTTQSVL